MNFKEIDMKKVGIIFIILGIILYFYDHESKLMMLILLVVMLTGFGLATVGLIKTMIHERKKKENLQKDIDTIIQPTITKYSNKNKELIKNMDVESSEYIQERLKMNKEMEDIFKEKIPYLSQKEIKNMIIEFNKGQKEMYKK